jgi:hypothetical protein
MDNTLHAYRDKPIDLDRFHAFGHDCDAIDKIKG